MRKENILGRFVWGNKIIHLSVCDPLKKVGYEWRRYLMLLMSVSLV